jgi:predicted ATPase
VTIRPLAVSGYRASDRGRRPRRDAGALAGDGGDLPATVQTIADGFPGSHPSVSTGAGLFRLRFHQPGLLLPLEASELSDGTPRDVLLTVALLSPHLPPLPVLQPAVR